MKITPLPTHDSLLDFVLGYLGDATVHYEKDGQLEVAHILRAALARLKEELRQAGHEDA